MPRSACSGWLAASVPAVIALSLCLVGEPSAPPAAHAAGSPDGAGSPDTAGAPGEKKALVLRNVTIRIHPGQTVALCGPSGSGKTTILNLLLRFTFRAFNKAFDLTGEVYTWTVGWLLRSSLLVLVGYGPLLCAISMGAIIGQLRSADLKWDKTIKSGKARLPT